jgi:hypothetical protein
MNLSGTHQFLGYADDSNEMGGGVNTIQEKAETLVVVSMQTGLKVNADITKCNVMSCVQNAGRCHNKKMIIIIIIIIIMSIDCKWVDTRWQWSLNMLQMHGLWMLII